MHQQLWGYKVELKSVSRGTGGKEAEYHCTTLRNNPGNHVQGCNQTFPYWQMVQLSATRWGCIAILWISL